MADFSTRYEHALRQLWEERSVVGLLELHEQGLVSRMEILDQVYQFCRRHPSERGAILQVFREQRDESTQRLSEYWAEYWDELDRNTQPVTGEASGDELS